MLTNNKIYGQYPSYMYIKVPYLIYSIKRRASNKRRFFKVAY